VGADGTTAIATRACLDPASRAWIDALRSDGRRRDEAEQRLRSLLVRAARFQLGRRAPRPQLRGESIEDLAVAVGEDALVAVLAHLDDFSGASRFVTWACKFAIFGSSAALRKRTWKARALPDERDGWLPLATGAGAEEAPEELEWLQALRCAIDDLLTQRQRVVFVAIALNGAPIDVVAERLKTTRGAVYKTLHDARRKLRARLETVDEATPPPR
jgi:RNA polymerase sigma-70 factor, ECF subfamily